MRNYTKMKQLVLHAGMEGGQAVGLRPAMTARKESIYLTMETKVSPTIQFMTAQYVPMGVIATRLAQKFVNIAPQAAIYLTMLRMLYHTTTRRSV
jgi:hypothetical protein